MQEDKKNFTHESLQDAQSISRLLDSITAGLEKGKLTFSDEENSIDLKPQGLLELKLTASQNENNNRLNIKVSWQTPGKKIKKKNLSVSSK